MQENGWIRVFGSSIVIYLLDARYNELQFKLLKDICLVRQSLPYVTIWRCIACDFCAQLHPKAQTLTVQNITYAYRNHHDAPESH